MNMFHIALLSCFIAIGSFKVQAKQAEENLNFCYFSVREELSTSVVLIGKNKNFFKDEGINIVLKKDTELIQNTKDYLRSISNINKASADRHAITRGYGLN